MPASTRRRFLREASALAAAAAPAAYAAARSGAGERIAVGVIGCGGQGMSLLKSFAAMKDVAVAHVCDADRNHLAAAAKEVGASGGTVPKAAADLRRILDDQSLDAVVIATPDHWHAPATLLACAAGKHVYVEKPCAHNIREGRLMIEAARRHRRVVQVGTQSRSTPHVQEAMQLLREGIIGEVLVAKAWNSQLRGNIGRKKPSEPPPELDFDLWLGPAPQRPYQSNLLHGNWRWWYDFGTGDIGNDGVHDIDIARWGLGVQGHPTAVTASGGKYFFDDDQQFADTYHVAYEYPVDGPGGRRRTLVYEQRTWSPYFQEGYENGNAFYGTKGMMIVGKKGGWAMTGVHNRPGRQRQAELESTPHHRNFLDCIRAGREPNADVEIGHYSAALSHLGNIAVRLDRKLRFDPLAEVFLEQPEAQRLVGREYRNGHWAVPAEARSDSSVRPKQSLPRR